MLKIKQIVKILIILFILCPLIKVNAATSLSATNQTPVVGSTFDIDLYIDYGKTVKISSAHYIINYDPTCYSFQNLIWTQSYGTYRNESGKVYIDKTNDENSWSYGIPVTTKFKVLKACKSEFNISLSGDATFEDGSKVAQTTSGITVNSVLGDSSTQLESLYINGYNLAPTFNKDVYSYTLSVPSNVSEVNITAIKGESTQTITGTGIKKIAYGDNKARIVVTSQSGSTNTYEIMIHRLDNRTADTSLKSLTVTNTDIIFLSGKDNYEATVSKNINSVFITAKTNDSESQLVGTGKKELKVGLNTFEVKVKAANGSEKIYTINITRSSEEIQTDKESTNLISLNINNYDITLSYKQNKYLIGINSDINKLTINYVTESKNANVKITGNENLQPGLNTITLKITDNNKSNEIKLIVYKKDSNSNILSSIDVLSLENLKDKNILAVNELSSHQISKDKISIIKNSKKTLYYNVINDYQGLLYQLKLDSDIPEVDLDTSIIQTSNNPLTYKTELPSGIKVLLYLNTDLYKDSTTLKIYTYDEIGKYTLLSSNITMKNSYISFITNGAKNYVITTQDLIREETFIDKLQKNIKNILIGVVLMIIIITIIIYLLKNKNKSKDANEPLY